MKAVLVRSFARIHETNLKKQGILPLIFADPADWERIEQRDRVSVTGPGRPGPRQARAGGRSRKPDGRESHHPGPAHLHRTKQIDWFQAGSALNALRHD